MNMHDNDAPPSGKPPAGLMASQALAEPVKTPAASTTVSPETSASFPNVDPGYIEPVSLASLKVQIGEVGKSSRDAQDVIVEYQTLLAIATDRIGTLERALLPFAVQALTLANMHMCLAGEGRTNEPAGGTWINGIQSAQMQSNEVTFYRAADALGRAHVEEHVMQLFKRVQESNVAADERDKHIENSALIGPIGGPVDGQVH